MNSYLENMVNTSNPVRLVIMLYERAILALETALEIMNKENPSMDEIKTKYEELLKANDILIALGSTLDMEKGGEIAKNLHEIYSALSNDLVRLSMKDDPETIKKMIKILKELKEGWEEVENLEYRKPKAVAT